MSCWYCFGLAFVSKHMGYMQERRIYQRQGQLHRDMSAFRWHQEPLNAEVEVPRNEGLPVATNERAFT